MKINERKYDVTLNGKTFHQRVELHDGSEAYAYGNQTYVLYYDGLNAEPHMYDTRYERGIVSNFEQWADKFIDNELNPKCTVEVVGA